MAECLVRGGVPDTGRLIPWPAGLGVMVPRGRIAYLPGTSGVTTLPLGVGASARTNPAPLSSDHSSTGIGWRMASALARACSGVAGPGITDATTGGRPAARRRSVERILADEQRAHTAQQQSLIVGAQAFLVAMRAAAQAIADDAVVRLDAGDGLRELLSRVRDAMLEAVSMSAERLDFQVDDFHRTRDP